MSSSATEGVPTSDGQRFIPGDGPITINVPRKFYIVVASP